MSYEITVESFLNHTPGEEDVKRMIALREAHIQAFNMVKQITPDCPEKTLAIRKLEESLMWANKAVVLNPFDGVKNIDWSPVPEAPTPV